MLTYIEERVAKKEVWISTSESNGAMRALLVRRGFEESGVIRNLGAGAEMVFRKVLPEGKGG